MKGFLLLALVTPLAAQRPSTWVAVPDQQGPDSALKYSTMPPGWHVTTGPGALFFDPAWQVAPAGVVHAEIFLFPDSGPGEYGVFLSGNGLTGAARGYTAVLLRRDGQVGVFRHSSAGVDTVLTWTANSAVAGLDGKTDGAVKNVVRIEARPESVIVSVNGATVATLPGSGSWIAGQAGLRVGERMNLHVSKFEVRGQ